MNDKNIQLLMKKMDILGEQMKMMHQHKEETTSSPKDAHMIAEVKESGSPQRKRSLPIIPYKDTQELEEDWDENFAESTEAFDTIMTDAETKKRTAAVDVAKTTKPKWLKYWLARANACGALYLESGDCMFLFQSVDHTSTFVSLDAKIRH